MKRNTSVAVIRVDGSHEQHTVSAWHEMYKLIGADCFESVNLRDGTVMLVDDTGIADGKPVNPEATKLYHAVCRPGTRNQIHGDVIVATDNDFA